MTSAMGAATESGIINTSPPKTPQWPAHNAPRVWFLTDGLSPIAISLSRHLLEHGDYVVAAILQQEYDTPRSEELREFLREVASDGTNRRVGDDVEPEDDQQGDADYEENGEAREFCEEPNDGSAGDGNTNNRRNEKSRTPRKRWRDRFKIVGMDGRNVGQCQSAIADALAAFQRIDILLICRSEALIGTIEELDQSYRAQCLVRDQFETNFFAPVNIIRALLPSMREKRNGHIVVLTGISAHLGTPGLAMYCSSQWALEGYCDSLSYEIAPFNIKMTIVQPNLEIPVLTNKITSVPPMAEYSPDANGAPLSREILSAILDKLEGDIPPLPTAFETETPSTGIINQNDFTSPAASAMTASTPLGCDDSISSPLGATDRPSSTGLTQGDLLHATTVTSLFPNLPPSMKSPLVSETVFAIAAIGGHDNPPSRHIVGHEGVASVKEKLKTISEELEDFLGVSGAVDIGVDPVGIAQSGEVDR
ncbi:uncharacterized protein PV09_09262 [Verruconis gallopava]|uniref:Ketoreductase (KR) domain-containing protein n=1 Tax=Verruconis gallopava TaxID=253628 RepID=A0A0D1XA64_9PEZI|nr:uncharacterized protein PV09_09262 [Verruconis gallopava]KIV99035.1 hypothetical protein PV09_09262 [Verruconis gallopava]